ncbi:MAG: outer membrane lipoprotein carrier protein LolA [Gammaproteobacteria bacterium HGW-Gammaproteobacteria-3]|nr:MAG: outer membrane lipoprotein carrier protein LolA [Gammaproteobacteria bacterium HGW-Gammaproteobacteria-3]
MRYSQVSGGIFLFLVLTAANVFAEVQPLQQLRAFLASSKSLSADFRQVAIDESGRPGQTSYGVFYLNRPGKFRWNYLKPFRQEIVANAGKVWFYDEDLEQVTIRKIDQSLGSTPALLLSGDIDIEDNFTLEHQGRDGDLLWLKLLPKNEDSGFKYILMGLDNGVLGGMELSDNFGQLTRIYFSNVKINPPLKNSLFKFTPPEGVDIFEE